MKELIKNACLTENWLELLPDINLEEPYNKLNRLKPIIPEAFYYIWQGIKK